MKMNTRVFALAALLATLAHPIKARAGVQTNWTPGICLASPNGIVVTNAYGVFNTAGMGFTLVITGAVTQTSQLVAVEACSNLANPQWIKIGVNVAAFTPAHNSDVAVITDPNWTNYSTGFYRVTATKTINLDRITSQMHNLATINPATTNFTLFGFGDSANMPGDSPTQSLVNHLAGRYGLLSANQDDYIRYFQLDFWLMTAGASRITAPDNVWWSDYAGVPIGGTVTYTNPHSPNGTFVGCNGADVFWVPNSIGGSFKIQADTGSGFADLLTVSSLSATQLTTCTNVSFGVANARFKIVGISGVSYVTMIMPRFGSMGLSNSPIIRGIYGGKGGVPIGNGLGTLLGVDSNTLWTAVRCFHPDQIVWFARHELNWSGPYATNFPYLMNIFKSAAPQSEVLLFGAYPATTDDQQGLCTPILAQYAITNNCSLIDLAAIAPETNYAQLNNWFVEGTSPGLHYTLASYDTLLAQYYSAWGISNSAVIASNAHLNHLALQRPRNKEAAP